MFNLLQGLTELFNLGTERGIPAMRAFLNEAESIPFGTIFTILEGVAYNTSQSEAF